MLRIFTVVLLLFSSVAFADLNVGDSAPQLKIEKWLKGTSVEKFEPGRIYIVEFWGTWCTPCVANIPHLNEIAKKYPNDITIIGVADQDSKNEDKGLSEVEEFLKKNDPSIEYTVAFDGTEETKKLWMEASFQHGIPTVFVVDRNGKIAFFGHPTDLESDEFDNPLKMVLEGTWQKSEKLAKYHSDKKIKDINQDRYIELMGKLADANEKEDWISAYNWAVQGAWIPDNSLRAPFIQEKASLLIEQFDRPEAGLEQLKIVIAINWDHVQALGGVLKLLLHDKMPKHLQDMELAEKVAKQTWDLATNHPDKLHRDKYLKYAWLLQPPVAEYHFKAGRPDLAVDILTSVLKTMPDDEDYAEDKAQLEKDLIRYNEMFEKTKSIVATSIAAAPTAIRCEGGVCYIPADNDCQTKLK